MGFRFACVAVAAIGLSSCGGGSDVQFQASGATQKPQAARQAGMQEVLDCRMPERVVIERADVGGQPTTQRFVQHAGEPLVRMVPASGVPTAKNPEGVVEHGPMHRQNCVGGQGALQRVSLSFQTRSYFGSPTVNHLALAFLMTSSATQAPTRFDGLGLALFGAPWGPLGERFSNTPPMLSALEDVPLADRPLMAFRDGVVYRLSARVSPTFIDYRIEGDDGQVAVSRRYVPEGFEALQGQGVGMAVLCSDGNGRCENVPPFRVEFFDISASMAED